jgi:HD-GYP domain-containing protein (c-di-GMP phosphodiesterase class II)
MSVENPLRSEPISFEETEALERTLRARSIACDLELIDKSLTPNDLRFTHILGRLREDELLESEVERVKKVYGESLGEFGNELEPDVWELFTVLELFDPETAQHCIDTYQIAKGKVESTLFNGVILADWFKREGVDTHKFYVSCLLHDIGKVEVPHSVVVNKISDEECASLLYAEKDSTLLPALRAHFHDDSYELPPEITSGEALSAYFYNTLHIRPKAITPVRLLLGSMSPEDEAEIAQQLAHCGHTLDDTLLDIMSTHDRYSHDILHESGHEIEAKLAGSHHSNKEHAYTITIGTLRVSVDLADIIHLADVENALMSTRYYKEGETPLYTLKVLAIHAKQGKVPSYITYLWIADTLHKMQNSFDLTDESEKANYTFIENFLEEQKRTHLAYPDWHKGITEDLL